MNKETTVIETEKSHICSNCLISSVCSEACDKYYPDDTILNSLIQIQRATNFCKNNNDMTIILQCYTDKIEYLIEKDNDRILHRINGPAVEYKDGRKEWWVNGKFIKNNKDI